jgi:hypothetical protein
MNTIWVSYHEGENPADIENIGPVEYLAMFPLVITIRMKIKRVILAH